MNAENLDTRSIWIAPDCAGDLQAVCELEQAQSSFLDQQRLARLEAILSGVPGDRELRLVLEQLDPGHGGTFTWLDQRNASIALMPGSAAVSVQVLLELKGRGALGVLVISREGMGRGAPLSRDVLEQLLERLQQLLPDSCLIYRSDRDGPVGNQTITG